MCLSSADPIVSRPATSWSGSRSRSASPRERQQRMVYVYPGMRSSSTGSRRSRSSSVDASAEPLRALSGGDGPLRYRWERDDVAVGTDYADPCRRHGRCRGRHGTPLGDRPAPRHPPEAAKSAIGRRWTLALPMGARRRGRWHGLCNPCRRHGRCRGRHGTPLGDRPAPRHVKPVTSVWATPSRPCPGRPSGRALRPLTGTSGERCGGCDVTP